jgi:hypothetical protein
MRQPRLFNAAYKAHAWQSSTARSNRKQGAHRGIDGGVGKRSYFMTKREDQPWWMVDLSGEWPIHSIRIHNRRRPSWPAATGLKVSLSSDGKTWEVVHSGHHTFGDALSPGPLVIDLRDRTGGRFVRLELPFFGRLALNQVEVMVAERHKALFAVARRYGFDLGGVTFRKPRHVKPYSVQNVPRNFDGRLEALHVDAPQGRFGNNLLQIARAVTLAQRLGIPRVYLSNLPMLALERPVTFGEVTVLPASALRRDRPKGALCGPFYDVWPFDRALDDLRDREVVAAARAVGTAAFHGRIVDPAIVPGGKDLAVHLRAGDIFKERPHRQYTQPPLAYYRLCIEFARTQVGIERVILVYENERNPCVPALKAWLGEIGLPFVVQSRTLAEDLGVLLAASHVVFGRGTFGLAIAMLSTHLRTLFHSWLQPDFGPILEATGVRQVSVTDVAGGYIKVGDWRNAPEQRRMMLDYPIENLRIEAGRATGE